ncbi:hypothetical protein ESO86_12195 [Agromyces binzhouensis]|uniref:Uncharacterized protein n=1 Tax=Agromyces binzhouensis TaxID=1817495 RepID=A0A4V1QRT4_9MICO|nr:hypothetical protein ESO86_12195 [Agromyces binzhouensis]
MNIDPLVESILAAIALLENSPDSEIDPDVAVNGIESVADSLDQLDEDGRREFIAAVERVAEAQTDSGTKRFYLSVPRLLGL